LQKENPVSEIFWGRLNLQTASSFLFFNKGGKVQHLMHLLKYKGRDDVGRFLGRSFGVLLKQSQLYRGIDFIVPVPLHPKKQKSRGFNQSEEIAKGMQETLETSLNTGNLLRRIHTDSQTRKSRYNRWENVRDVFFLRDPKFFVGKHVLLLDDVLTTGATLEACGSVIEKVNDVRISAVTIACAQA
jgi:ComF family protein